MNNSSHLLDLDELVLLCRDEKARAYINEAVSCYRAGAFRASIVVTWVAVCYDIIDKLREIALSGDKDAAITVKAIEEARNRNDIASLLKFEKDILDLTTLKFELLSSSERIDLARLQDDRNRCAHPSMISEEQSFNPPGELARLHIRNTVTHLLQHQPVQGKYALERVLREVEFDYFPTTQKEATIALSSGPLKRARKSLIRSFCTVIFKELISGDVEYKRRSRLNAAIKAVMQIHHEDVLSIMKEQLPKIVSDINDDHLRKVATLVADIPECTEALTDNVRARIIMYIENIPTADFDSLESYYYCAHLKKHVERRMSTATRKDFEDALFFTMPSVLCDRLIQLYLKAPNFAEANWAAATIMSNMRDLSLEQKSRILENIKSNVQLLHSNTLSALIAKSRESMGISDEKFDQVLVANGLEKHVKKRAEIDDDIPF